MQKIICSDPSVEGVGDLLTMQLGPAQVLLTVDIKFCRGLDVQQLESAIDRIERRIREQEPTVGRIFIEADALKAASDPVAPGGLRNPASGFFWEWLTAASLL
jgi:divalent metal cation (Fe/Co/Zn/Cd) transporter